MKVVNSVYNVMTIEIEDAMTSGVAQVIGTNEDYARIKKIANKSGLLRVKATIGELPMFGTLNVNPWCLEDKLEVSCVTYGGDALYAVIGTLEPTDDGMKATVTLNSLS